MVWTEVDRSAIERTVFWVLVSLWCLLVCSFACRVANAWMRRRRDRTSDVTLLDRIDILTPSGAALSWLGAGAIILSTSNGWASLSLVGVMGLGVLHLAATWALWMTGGDDPWRRSSLSRRFVTERAVEGGPLIEELALSSPRIPMGFRLFARGRIGDRWATSRYVIEGGDDGGDTRMQTDVGPAIRGAHEAEPLEVWLQDILGLCHSMRSRVGDASILVLPRPRTVRGAREILRARGGLDQPRTEVRAPSEGSLGLREYQPGDDARRIHWARSLSAGQTIVRTPDEIPCDRTAVRLVLDTYLPDAGTFTCAAPAELLDTLVALWLGVARTFADAGLRVDLVVAGPDRAIVVPLRRMGGLAGKAAELGARARWQEAVPLERMLSAQPAVVVSYRHQPVPPGAGTTHWILAREWAWVSFDLRPQDASPVCLPYPMGSPENSGARRRREQSTYVRARGDHWRFTRLCGDAGTADTYGTGGTWLATPSLGGAIHVEKLA